MLVWADFRSREYQVQFSYLCPFNAQAGPTTDAFKIYKFSLCDIDNTTRSSRARHFLAVLSGEMTVTATSLIQPQKHPVSPSNTTRWKEDGKGELNCLYFPWWPPWNGHSIGHNTQECLELIHLGPSSFSLVGRNAKPSRPDPAYLTLKKTHLHPPQLSFSGTISAPLEYPMRIKCLFLL